MRPAGDRPQVVAAVNSSLISGAERVLVRYLRAMTDAGWRVSCCGPSGPLAVELEGFGVDWVELPELKPGAGPRLGSLIGLARNQVVAARRIRKATAGADAVLVNALMALPAVAMARPPAPVVWLVHTSFAGAASDRSVGSAGRRSAGSSPSPRQRPAIPGSSE